MIARTDPAPAAASPRQALPAATDTTGRKNMQQLIQLRWLASGWKRSWADRCCCWRRISWRWRSSSICWERCHCCCWMRSASGAEGGSSGGIAEGGANWA